MDEARRVLERLDRIEALRRGAASPEVLIEEVRGLLADAETWVRTDAAGQRAEDALGRVRDALERRIPSAVDERRTLVA
jgi:hypothetical protein